jgi:endonuclease/exonuclease/phosphatase family metal-dependent hydrolase
VDVRLGDAKVRVFATHLEAPIGPGDATQIDQGLELIEVMGRSELPVILAGDLNSDASGLSIGPNQTPTAAMIVAAGHGDVWQTLRPEDLGLTWPPYLEDIYAGQPVTPFERIDLIFAKGLDPLRVRLVGTAAPFPSDHADVVASLKIDK